jgi:hypothetical protein
MPSETTYNTPGYWTNEKTLAMIFLRYRFDALPTMLSTALQYAKRGWRVLPVHYPTAEGRCSCGEAGCPAVGKHPMIGGWSDDATTEPTTIQRWYKSWPKANIGLAFGSESGIVDIEVDPRSGGDRNLPRLEAKLGKLPPTLSYRSGGGGRHRLYIYPHGTRIRKATHIGRDLLSIDPKKPTGIDIVSDGGQAVAPPSRHVSGKTYQWDDPEAEPVELPPAWVAYLGEDRRASAGSSIEELLLRGSSQLEDITEEKARDILAHIDADCDYGQWMRVGQALLVQFATDPDTGLGLFDEWSKTAATKYPGRRAIEKQWDSYGKNADKIGNVTFRSVIHLAKQGGWTPPKAPRAPKNEEEDQLRKADQRSLEDLSKRLEAADIIEDMHEIAAEIRTLELFDSTRDQLVGVIQKTNERLTHGKKISIKAARSLISDESAKEQRAIDLANEGNWFQSFIYLSDHRMGTFYNHANGQMMSPKVFDDNFSSELISPIMRAQGKLVPIFPPTDLVLNSSLVEKVSAPRYAPGRPLIFEDNGQTYANTYRAPPGEAADPMLWTEAEKAAIKRIEDHGEWMIGPERARILFQFLAYIVQNPEARVRWCYIIIGPKGIGKTFFGGLARAALGKGNVRDIGQATLSHTDFNSWTAGAQLNVIEEIRVEGTKKHEIMNALKAAITNDVVDVHRKGIDAHQEDNTCSYLAFTNYQNAIMVDEHDRRYYMIDTTFHDVEGFMEDLGGEKASIAYFTKLFDTLRFQDAIRGWLMSYDISDFSPERAKDSEEKEALVDASRSDLEVTLHRMLREGGERWNEKAIDIAALRAALNLEADAHGVSGQALARALRELGFKPAAKYNLNPFNDGVDSKWYINPRHIKPRSGLTSRYIRESFEV